MQSILRTDLMGVCEIISGGYEWWCVDCLQLRSSPGTPELQIIAASPDSIGLSGLKTVRTIDAIIVFL